MGIQALWLASPAHRAGEYPASYTQQTTHEQLRKYAVATQVDSQLPSPLMSLILVHASVCVQSAADVAPHTAGMGSPSVWAAAGGRHHHRQCLRAARPPQRRPIAAGKVQGRAAASTRHRSLVPHHAAGVRQHSSQVCLKSPLVVFDDKEHDTYMPGDAAWPCHLQVTACCKSYLYDLCCSISLTCYVICHHLVQCPDFCASPAWPCAGSRMRAAAGAWPGASKPCRQGPCAALGGRTGDQRSMDACQQHTGELGPQQQLAAAANIPVVSLSSCSCLSPTLLQQVYMCVMKHPAMRPPLCALLLCVHVAGS